MNASDLVSCKLRELTDEGVRAFEKLIVDARDGLSVGDVRLRAMEIAGIDASSPDPYGGKIHRKENGEPTGLVAQDQAAQAEQVGREQQGQEQNGGDDAD